MDSTPIKLTNHIKNPVLVKIDINRIKKILKDRKGSNEVLDNLEKKIDVLESNSSEVTSSFHKPNVESPSKIADKLKLEFMNGYKPLDITDKPGKEKSKTVCLTHILNIDKEIEKKMKGIPIPEIKICIKEKRVKKNLPGKKKLKLIDLINPINLNVDNIASVKSMIPLPPFKINSKDNIPNKSKKFPCIRFRGYIDILSSDEENDNNNNKSEKCDSTINETSSEVVVVSEKCSNQENDSIQQALLIRNYNPDSCNKYNPDKTNMAESNMSKKSVQIELSDKILNSTSLSYTTDLIDLTLDSDSDNESNSILNTMLVKKCDNFNYEKYDMLRTIVFSNYDIYHRQIMITFAKKLLKNKLLWELKDAWHTSKADIINIILEDILKLIFHVKNKNIVFMGCLSIIFRETTLSFHHKSETDLYNHFKLFTDVIEKCLMNINYNFWETIAPNGWNIFCDGCLIVDHIIHGNDPLLSLGMYVNWNEISNILICDYNLNNKPVDELHSSKNMFNQIQSNNSLTSSTSNVASTAPIISCPVITNDKEPFLRKRHIDVSSMPSSPNKLPAKVPQTKDKKLVKKKSSLVFQ